MASNGRIGFIFATDQHRTIVDSGEEHALKALSLLSIFVYKILKIWNIDREEEDIVVSSCLLAEEGKTESKKKKKRKMWIYNINRKRLDWGEFHSLFPDFMENDM